MYFKTPSEESSHGRLERAMRGSDHQFIQPLCVSSMRRAGTEGARFDNQGSGYGFKTVRYLQPAQTEQATSCRMTRP